MNIKFVSNDYTFRYDLHLMVVKMINSSGSPVVEFYLNNQKVYYYLISEKETEELDDLAIINKAVDKMHEDTTRWISDCSFYLENLDQFILYERATVYKVEMNEFMHQYATVRIVEENNGRFVLYFKEEASGFHMITHLRANTREELIETMDGLAKLIIQTLKPFREKQELIILNAFGTDYALRRSSAIVDGYEFGNKMGGH